MNLTTFLITLVGVLLGALLGVAVYAWWLQQKSAVSLRLPRKWPLVSRPLITNEEYRVLKWLRATFHDHLVMIKVPVLRFTVPADAEQNESRQRWQTLLNGVYCTYTVCTANGNVIGCVDVPGKRGLSKSSRSLKESLLSDCHIAYTVVRSAGLPKGTAMRAAFLGEMEIEDQPEHQPTQGCDSGFHAELDSFTQQKKLASRQAALRELNKNNEDLKPPLQSPSAGFNRAGTGPIDIQKNGHRPQRWEDSFIQPDESRPAKLREL